MAVMFLEHGVPPPDTHFKGQNILPTDMPGEEPVRPALIPVQTKTPLEVYTASLPGDVPIVEKDDKNKKS